MRIRILGSILFTVLAGLLLAGPAHAAPKFEATPWTLTFEFVPVGSTSPSQEISIRNAGDGQLRPKQVQIEGLHPKDFVLTGDQCSGAVLNSDQRCSIRVAFRPTTNGTRVASIKVVDDSACPNWITIAGSGDNGGSRVVARAAACEQQNGADPQPQGGGTSTTNNQQGAGNSQVVGLPSQCKSRRKFTINVKRPKGKKIEKVRVKLNDREFKVIKGKNVKAEIDLSGLPRGRFTLQVVVKTTDGKTYTSTRRYTTCVADR
jgi:hypothetical protein